MGVVPVVTRTTSTSFVELGNSNLGMTKLVGEEEEKEKRGAQLRSKTVSGSESMHVLQKTRDPKVGKAGQRSLKSRKNEQEVHSPRPSKWTRFWRKLRGSKRVAVARPFWLNYDSESYAMNFEEDFDACSFTAQQMPKISGPRAREIVTVLLTRSPTTHRNSGAILIPKPVISDIKQETNSPLWMRRSISAPAPLDVRMRRPAITRRRGVSS